MYELVRRLPFSRIALEQVPQLAIALVIAEVFYQFHSFLLEASAFLLTWFLIGAAWSSLQSLLDGRRSGRS
ncbi:MAG TPA: hypothetical protein VFQ51_07265 [Vicinamibacteria bacterium]|nr:hypothetical protein [Vicinamibacteria bacterium]